MERGEEGDSVPETVDEVKGYTDDAVPDRTVTFDSRSRWRASRRELKCGTVCIWPTVVKNALVCADDDEESNDRRNASRGTLDPRLRRWG
jgi:hypothetical protein